MDFDEGAEERRTVAEGSETRFPALKGRGITAGRGRIGAGAAVASEASDIEAEAGAEEGENEEKTVEGSEFSVTFFCLSFSAVFGSGGVVK